MQISPCRNPRVDAFGEHRPFCFLKPPDRTLLGTVFLICALLAGPPVAMADYWYEHYARAESALANGKWNSAVEELQQAL